MILVFWEWAIFSPWLMKRLKFHPVVSLCQRFSRAWNVLASTLNFPIEQIWSRSFPLHRNLCTLDAYSEIATLDRFLASVSRWSCSIPPLSSTMEIKETHWSSSCRQVDIYWTWCKTMMIRNHLDAVFSSCCRLYFSQDKTKCSFLSNALFKPWQRRYVAGKPIVVVEVSSMWPTFPSVIADVE